LLGERADFALLLAPPLCGFVASVIRRRGNAGAVFAACKAVQQLALYDDRELAAGLRASGLNRQTNSLYAPFARNERLEFDQTLFSDYDEAVLRRNINRWVAGDVAPAQDGPSDLLGDGELIFNEDEAGGDETLIDRPSSRVFTVQPYTGELVEIER
ncbi:MAG: hypothetical protein AAFP26_11510, partial [Planctomycetota bacterium]